MAQQGRDGVLLNGAGLSSVAGSAAGGATGSAATGSATGSVWTHVQRFLEPFSKQELEDIILEVCRQTGDGVANSFLRRLKSDRKWCKLFVHQLAYSTTQQMLQDYYSQFGSVKEAVVLVDKKGSSKGYGFVTFENADSAIEAAKAEKKPIDGRMTHCTMAWKGNPKKLQGSGANPQNREAVNDRRLFVYSLAWKTDDDTLRNEFEKYGEIQEAVVIRDKKTSKSRGYGFVIFKTNEAAEKALKIPAKEIDGRMTHCNYACLGHENGHTPINGTPVSNMDKDFYSGNRGVSPRYGGMSPSHPNGIVRPSVNMQGRRGMAGEPRSHYGQYMKPGMQVRPSINEDAPRMPSHATLPPPPPPPPLVQMRPMQTLGGVPLPMPLQHEAYSRIPPGSGVPGFPMHHQMGQMGQMDMSLPTHVPAAPQLPLYDVNSVASLGNPQYRLPVNAPQPGTQPGWGFFPHRAPSVSSVNSFLQAGSSILGQKPVVIKPPPPMNPVLMGNPLQVNNGASGSGLLATPIVDRTPQRSGAVSFAPRMNGVDDNHSIKSQDLGEDRETEHNKS